MNTLSERLERQFLWILAMVLAGFLTAAGISAWTTTAFANVEALRIQAYTKLEILDAILLAFDDAETGQRGFLLTGDTGYLQPYHQAQGRVDEALDRLRRQMPAASLADVEHIRELKNRKFDELERTIALRQAQGLDAALPIVNSHSGKAYMDELRGIVAQLKATEKIHMEELQDRSVVHMSIYQYSATFFALFLMLVMMSVVTVIRRDAKSKREFVERLNHEASHDALTQLPNRNMFMSMLDLGIPIAGRYQRMLGVLFVDLDGFKTVNDTYGHATGDAVLKEAARRLKECSRESDVVARIGGDEFLILAPNITSQSDLEALASHVLAGFDLPIFPALGSVRVGASIGIAVFPKDGIHSTELVKAADAAMYLAKAQGKHRFAFHCTHLPHLT